MRLGSLARFGFRGFGDVLYGPHTASHSDKRNNGNKPGSGRPGMK